MSTVMPQAASAGIFKNRKADELNHQPLNFKRKLCNYVPEIPIHWAFPATGRSRKIAV